LAHCDEAQGRVVNLGNDEEITILDLAKLVRERLNSSSEIRFVPYDVAFRPGFEDMERRVPDLCRAQSLIGFKPKRNLHDVIDDILCDSES
jgi:UDP-glucose 4-epimerase